MSEVYWRVHDDDQCRVISIEGAIDQNADLESLLDDATENAVIDLAGIRRINSSGIIQWFHFLRKAGARTRTWRLVRCSPVVVNQLNMIRGFAAEAQIGSFFIPYICDECGEELDTLVEPSELRSGDGVPSPPETLCPECGVPMAVNTMLESYLSFLELTPHGSTMEADS